MTLKPCIYCSHSPDCDIRREKVTAVRGLGITTMTFRCQRLVDEYAPGTVVKVSTSLDTGRMTHGSYDDPAVPIYESGEVLATVMEWRGRKLLVAVHPGQSPTTDKPMMNVYPKKCAPTGKAQRVCVYCAKPEGLQIDTKDIVTGEPSPWVCRYDYGDICSDEPLAAIALPCEYVRIVDNAPRREVRS